MHLPKYPLSLSFKNTMQANRIANLIFRIQTLFSCLKELKSDVNHYNWSVLGGDIDDIYKDIETNQTFFFESLDETYLKKTIEDLEKQIAEVQEVQTKLEEQTK